MCEGTGGGGLPSVWESRVLESGSSQVPPRSLTFYFLISECGRGLGRGLVSSSSWVRLCLGNRVRGGFFHQVTKSAIELFRSPRPRPCLASFAGAGAGRELPGRRPRPPGDRMPQRLRARGSCYVLFIFLGIYNRIIYNAYFPWRTRKQFCKKKKKERKLCLEWKPCPIQRCG